MSISKTKMERDKERRGSVRKESLTEDYSIKDVMMEILKLQTEVTKIQEKQDRQYHKMREEMLEMKRDIKEEIQTLIKEEISKIRVDLELTQKSCKEREKEVEVIKKQQGVLRKEMGEIEKTINIVKIQQEILESKEKDFQLRFHNLREEENENIRDRIVEIVSSITQKSKEGVDNNIDKVFRIQSNYAKKYNTPRDVVVYFCKRNLRDEVLKGNASNPTIEGGNRIAILKEHPASVLEKRRKYSFLAEELRRRNIRFKWEKKEGLMLTFEGNRHWVTSEHKARAFYEKHLKRGTGGGGGIDEHGGGREEGREKDTIVMKI
nr:PREDICTED: uncharacterized protein LOC107982628 [Anolis carolinensis]|eukprot:XP_016847780.1 PREDICTED: uncharacterized protein LOC107982628 [Anolis carolinensis]